MDTHSLNSVNADVVRKLLGTRCNGSAGLAEGAGAHTIKILPPNSAVDIQFCIDGKAYTKAVTDSIAMSTSQYKPEDAGTASAFAVQGSTNPPTNDAFRASTRYYSIGINAAGTVLMVQGPEVGLATPSIGTAPLAAGNLPDVAYGCCLIGYMKIVNDATHGFVMGTTDLSAAGITATFLNCQVPPIADSF